MPLEIIIGNHQDKVVVPVSWLTALEEIGSQAAGMALEVSIDEENSLQHLAILEVAMVDDETSSKVHFDFMEIDGPTDVITFHHGEIVIGTEVALRQAEEYGEPLGREILRYFVHGLLHLAGFEDSTESEASAMEAAQEKIVAALWKGATESRLS